MEKKITFKKVLELIEIAYSSNFDSVKKDRLSAAWVTMTENLVEASEKYYKKLNKINQELCSVDTEGNFFLDEKQNPIYTKFTKANQIKKDEQVEKLLKEEVEVEFSPCAELARVKTLYLGFVKRFNGYLFDLSLDKIEEMFIEEEKEEPIKKLEVVN